MKGQLGEFGLKIPKGGLLGSSFGENNKKGKRTLGIRDKKILYRRAKGRCEACGKKIDFTEMQTGHKNAASKGGSATLRNSVCLCWRCNNDQGTDSWATYMKKLGKSKTTSVTSSKRKKSTKKHRKSDGTYAYNLLGQKVRVDKNYPFNW